MKGSQIKRSPLQRNIINLRKMLRQRLVLLARSHRGCAVARGCGCNTDQTMTLIEKAEADLFALEIRSYAGANDHGGYQHFTTEEAKAKQDQASYEVIK